MKTLFQNCRRQFSSELYYRGTTTVGRKDDIAKLVNFIMIDIL